MTAVKTTTGATRLRSVLGVCGELVITFGVLVLAYGAWLFFWTSVDARADAHESVRAFSVAVAPAGGDVAPLHTEEPPVPPTPNLGDTLGVLQVPRWSGLTDNAMPIREGTRKAILDQAAAGHYVDSQLPGQVGNMALAGHRRTYGNSFRYVDRLRVGDALVVETADTWYVYRVNGSEIVRPDQSDVVAPVPHQPEVRPTQRLLTLTTCHSLTQGEYGNDHRWITYAELEGWLPRAEGTPAALTEELSP